MINHSISNKMISLNSMEDLNGNGTPHDANRRRRTPSKYAESIRELTKITSKNSRKDKNSESNQDESMPGYTAGSDKGNTLLCILPSKNKRIKLSIIIKKNPKPKLKKGVSSVSLEKEKQKQKQKQRPKNTSLLDTLLQVVEQYKVDQQNRKDQSSPKGNQAPSIQAQVSKREGRSRKDKQEQEKYLRFYEKYKILNEKFQYMENEMILI